MRNWLWGMLKMDGLVEAIGKMGSSMDPVTQSSPGRKKLACDPSWKTVGSFRRNYLGENHKEVNGMWDFKFPYFNQLELVYGRDRATGGVSEGFGEAIRNMESQQNVESGGENLGGYHVSLSDDEGTDVKFMSKETQSS
ncbi:hypothetical protein Tco_0503273 [Tanacetum coccineum]